MLAVIPPSRIGTTAVPALNEDTTAGERPSKETVLTIFWLRKDLFVLGLTSLLFSEGKARGDLSLALLSWNNLIHARSLKTTTESST